MLGKRHRVKLQLQRWTSWLNAPWFIGLFLVIFKVFARYSCDDIKRIRRETLELMTQSEDAPIIICSNHLTMIDSMIINWLLFSYWSYLRRWRWMPWNMPEYRNFARNIPLRAMCYLGKCLYIERGGSVSGQRLTIEKFKQLLEWRELICIFPEGTRSRTGRIRGSLPTYSVGELCQQVPEAKVLCVYLRGKKQQTWGFFPARHENFHIATELIHPRSSHEGRRGAKDIAEQIMSKLIELEDRYFSAATTAATNLPS